SRETFEVQELDRLGRRYLYNKLGASRNQSLFQASIWGFSGLGVLIILYFGALEVGRGALTTGDLAAFLMYNLNLYWPMIALGWVTMLFTRAEASLKRLNELADTPPDPSRDGSGGHRPAGLRGEVEFDRVSHRYTPEGPPVLHDVSFRVEPGRTLAIVGPVGSGKSTVANLLLRLYDATAGSVRVDGLDIRQYDANSLRAFMGYVPQDSFLFSDTIANNIALGMNPDDPARAETIARCARAAEFEAEVLALPKGYDTMLGERGVNLSGGQKQRAAIARALARNPVILVLDDCLSAVDTDTEERILRNLKQLSQNITTVIIAQRISAVQHADEIIVLDEGRVVERGTDSDLRALGGLYADLARRQELAAQLA
ncbi:MAG: ABC transporter ATP-binding protein/permease, partial [Planctomycetes bacterium]|nr:ABC transporter ATP-binding protein/permease [Planctomycetota bacterium]